MCVCSRKSRTSRSPQNLFLSSMFSTPCGAPKTGFALGFVLCLKQFSKWLIFFSLQTLFSAHVKEKPKRNVGKNEWDNYLGLTVALSVSLLSLILMRIINTQHSHGVPCEDETTLQLALNVLNSEGSSGCSSSSTLLDEAFLSHFRAAV